MENGSTIEPAGPQPQTTPLRWFDLLPPLIFAAVVFILLGDVLFSDGRRVLGAAKGDMPLQFLPWRDFGFRELRNGNLALWNPHIYGGAPFFGGFQSALLYPPNWLHLVLPLGHAINWGIALHVFLAGYFTYLWCRHRGVSRVGATMAGGALMLGGQYVLRIVPGHLPHLCVMVWTPVLLLAMDGWRDEAPRHWGWVLLGMTAVAMQVLAGHPQYVYYTGLVAALYAALLAVRAPRRLPFLLGFAAMYVGGVLLSAVQLLAGMHAVGESIRGGGTPEQFARQFFLPFEQLLTLFAPRLFGDAVNTVYVGRWFHWETSLFLGVTTALLAGYAALLVPGSRRRFAVTMTVATLLLALGAQTPLFDLLYRALPGFASFRGHAKFAHFSSLFLVLLAGMGFDDLLAAIRAGDRLRRTAALATAAGGGGVALAILAVALSPRWLGTLFGAWSQLLATSHMSDQAYGPASYFTDPAAVAASAHHAALGLLIAAATAAVFAIALLVARSWRHVAYALPALLAIEMVSFAWPATPTGPVVADGYDPAWTAALDRERRAYPDMRVLHRGIAFANWGMTLGYSDVWGYDPLVLRRYGELIGYSQGEDPDAADPFMTFVKVPPMFRMLRLRHFFERHPNRPAVLTMDEPLGRFELVAQSHVVTRRDERLRMLMDEKFDPRRTVLLEQPVPVKVSRDRPIGSVTVHGGADTDHVDFTAETDRPALLLITDSFSTGWRVTALPDSPSGDRAYEILPANHALMAVPLSRGKHHLRLEYSPLPFRIGAWVSGVSTLGFLAAVGWLAARRNRAS